MQTIMSAYKAFVLKENPEPLKKEDIIGLWQAGWKEKFEEILANNNGIKQNKAFFDSYIEFSLEVALKVANLVNSKDVTENTKENPAPNKGEIDYKKLNGTCKKINKLIDSRGNNSIPRTLISVIKEYFVTELRPISREEKLGALIDLLSGNQVSNSSSLSKERIMSAIIIIRENFNNAYTKEKLPLRKSLLYAFQQLPNEYADLRDIANTYSINTESNLTSFLVVLSRALSISNSNGQPDTKIGSILKELGIEI